MRIKPKTDCFAYQIVCGDESCKALTDLYCRFGGPCNFYKKASESNAKKEEKMKTCKK